MASSSDSDDSDAPRPVLPVPQSEPLPTGPPATAAQYLALVRAETASLPTILRASPPPPSSPPSSPSPASTLDKARNNVTSTFSAVTTALPASIPRAPSHALPDPAWQASLLDSFASIQRRLLAASNTDTPSPVDDAAAGGTAGEERVPDVQPPRPGAQPPALATLRRLDHIHRLALLRQLDEALGAPPLSAPPSSVGQQSPPPPDVLAQRFVDEGLGAWIFSLLALFFKPLCAEAASLIRSILRYAALARCYVVDDERRLASVNVIITITGQYFGQDDF